MQLINHIAEQRLTDVFFGCEHNPLSANYIKNERCLCFSFDSQ